MTFTRAHDLHPASPTRPSAPVPEKRAPSRLASDLAVGFDFRTISLTREQAAERAARERSASSTSALAIARPALPVQAKLEVGSVDEPLEREADAIAERVVQGGTVAPSPAMASSGNVVQRTCSCCSSGSSCACEHEDEKVHRSAISGARPARFAAPAIVHDVLAESGQPLDAATRAFMEPRLGADLGHVRMHAGPLADASARAIGARAYTVGAHIVLPRSAPASASLGGRRLLAHELAHVVQQGAASQAEYVRRAPAGGDGPVPAEKTSEMLEQMYRRQGDTRHADAIRQCRTQGACGRVITNAQLRALYQLGKSSGGDEAKIRRGLLGPALGFVSTPALTGGTAAGGAGTAVGTGVAGDAAVGTGVVAGDAAAGGAATAGGVGAGAMVAGVAAVALVAVLLGIALYEEYKISELRRSLEDLGYTVLDDPLQVCIGGCHAPAAPRQPDFGRGFPDFPDTRPLDDDALRRWIEATNTTGTSTGTTTTPAPAPKPLPPIGTAPHERRIPTQTCENSVLDTLQGAMHAVCDRIPGDSCSPKKVSPKKLARRPCSQIRLRITAVEECLRRRKEIQDTCFGGRPDPRHEIPLEDLENGLKACRELEKVNCAPGHPMSGL